MKFLPALILPALFLLAAATGCATASQDSVSRWAVGQGGVVEDARADIARAVLADLRCSHHDADLSVSVLRTDRPVAYAWPCGRIFVSTGLVDLLSRDELAAAIAHEIGHLASDPAPQSGVALSGDHRHSAHDACEIAADLAGQELLRRAGMPEAALPSMLRKVAGSRLTAPALRPMLEHRASLLASE